MAVFVFGFLPSDEWGHPIENHRAHLSKTKKGIPSSRRDTLTTVTITTITNYIFTSQKYISKKMYLLGDLLFLFAHLAF